MLFSQRDMDVLRLLCWCQYVFPDALSAISSETELGNLAQLGLIRQHKGSGGITLSNSGRQLLQTVFDGKVPQLTQSYHGDAIQRRLRLSQMVLTAYQGGIDPFTISTEDLSRLSTLFLSAITRSRGSNPWGSTRVAAIAHLGDTFHAVHYVCPGIGRLSLTDELTAFTNQTARFQNVRRALIFAGESYGSSLTELEQAGETDTKLVSYGNAYRCVQMPVHLLSCDDTGAVQLQIMSIPDYRRRLTKAALKNQYQPPGDAPAWDAVFQGIPFIMAADMDLRRVETAIQAAREKGIRQIAIAALRGQAETVLFSRYRDTGLARVFVLTDEAIAEVTGRPPVPYIPPRTQFVTPKGDVVDAPPIQAAGKAGRSRGTEMRRMV